MEFLRIMRGAKTLLPLCLLALPDVGAQAMDKIAPDAGKFIVTYQENEIITETFKSDADGGSETEAEAKSGGVTQKFHISLKARQGRVSKIVTEAKPGGKFTLEVNGAIGKLTTDLAPKAKEVKLPANLYPFATIAAPHLLANVVAAYDKGKGGAQTFDFVYANVLGPQGVIQGKLTLTSQGAKPRQIGGKTVPVVRYVVGLPTPVGEQEMELATDTNGRVLMLSMATQKIYAARDGYQELTQPDTPTDPTLSKPTHEVKKETVKIAMRDGVKLTADVYRPAEDGKYPVILQRSCYGRTKALEATSYAKRGYVFVSQDVRGKFDSEGAWKPFVNEARDGYDSVEWCASQPWSTGNVGMIGGSYLGFVQWAAARENPPHLKCLIPIVSPPDPFFNVPYAFGAFLLQSDTWWTAIVEGKGMNSIPTYSSLAPFKTLPVSDVDKAVFGHHVDFFQEWLRHPTNDAYWQQVNFNDRMKTMPDIPALHVSGWFDGDGIGTKRNYAAMAAAHPNQRLIYGPWSHAVNTSTKIGTLNFGPQSARDLDTLYLRWFDHWLKGVDNGVDREKPVEAFLMGHNEWRQFTAWPPKEATETRWYFHSAGHANADKSDGKLSLSKPSAEEKPDHFTYDPAHPYIPGDEETAVKADANAKNVKNIQNAKTSQKDSTTRKDEATTGDSDAHILTYTTDALEKEVIVAGPIEVHLAASTSARDTDWFAMLQDIGPDGKALNLCQGIIRARFRNGFEKAVLLTPGEIADYTLDLWALGNVFQKGHKIRVIASSSCFPLYDRNLNTGDNNGTTTKMVIAHQTVLHDDAHLSYLSLPTLAE